jgi:hypothetical protein
MHHILNLPAHTAFVEILGRDKELDFVVPSHIQ